VRCSRRSTPIWCIFPSGPNRRATTLKYRCCRPIAWLLSPTGARAPCTAQPSRKHAALSQHATQYRFDRIYLDSFIRANELFGDLPVVDLQQGAPPAAAATGGAPVEGQSTHAEEAKYVGIERRTIWLEDGHFVVSVDYSGKVGGKAGLAVSCFRYRTDWPFREMPKVHIRVGAVRCGVYDGGRKLSKMPVEILRRDRGFLLRIPLDFLGQPERIHGSARSYLGTVPLDWIAWRVLEVLPEAR
jgi:hypothetical protein